MLKNGIEIKIAKLTFPNVRLSSADISRFRGFIGELFSEYNRIHNHDGSGKVIYRYPLIQFRKMDGIPGVLALGNEAVDIFVKIFLSLENIKVGNKVIPIHEKGLNIDTVKVGYNAEMTVYRFISPWIGLNQKNYDRWIRTGSEEKRRDILESALVGNMLSFSKGIGYWLEPEQKIEARIDLQEVNVRLKGIDMKGFTGNFTANYLLPEYVGLGKSVSRGFGGVRRVV